LSFGIDHQDGFPRRVRYLNAKFCGASALNIGSKDIARRCYGFRSHRLKTRKLLPLEIFDKLIVVPYVKEVATQGTHVSHIASVGRATRGQERTTSNDDLCTDAYESVPAFQIMASLKLGSPLDGEGPNAQHHYHSHSVGISFTPLRLQLPHRKRSAAMYGYGHCPMLTAPKQW